MRKRKSELQEREVIRLKASPAAFVGIVHVPDEQVALKVAIEQFKIRPKHRDRLIVRRRA